MYLENAFFLTKYVTCILSHTTSHSKHTLHPIRPHSIFIQKRSDTKDETQCTWKMPFWIVWFTCILSHITFYSSHTLYSFNKRIPWLKLGVPGKYIFWTKCVTSILSHNLSLKTHYTSNQTTLYIHSKTIRYGVPRNLDSMTYLNFVSHNLLLNPHYTSNQATLYIHSKNEQIPWQKFGVPGICNF